MVSPTSLMTPLLISFPISSPDEPLKWQYVDQFVSGSEVRARPTVMGSGWTGLQGGAAGPERGLALGMCLRGFHTCPCASRKPLWVVGPQPSPAGMDLPAPRDRMAIRLTRE